jgi:hypothetical protein
MFGKIITGPSANEAKRFIWKSQPALFLFAQQTRVAKYNPRSCRQYCSIPNEHRHPHRDGLALSLRHNAESRKVRKRGSFGIGCLQ